LAFHILLVLLINLKKSILILYVYCINTSYTFSESGQYYIPKHTTIDGYLEHIKSLPINPQPEVFGLHENADITKNNYETSLVSRLL